MARARHGLADKEIEALQPKEDGRERIVRDGKVPGLVLRRGRRRTTWELRIEQTPRANVALGHWPSLRAADARRAAELLWERHAKGLPLVVVEDSAPTIDSVWPKFKERLTDDGKSDRTLDGYKFAFQRLHEDVRGRPLADLAKKPTLMANEVARIRKALHNKKRGGQAAASQCARFVSSLFGFAVGLYPELRDAGNPVSGCSLVDPKRHDLKILHRADMPEWWTKTTTIKNDVERWALVFTLLSGLRRESLVSLRWDDLHSPVLKSRAIHVRAPKGGEERGFDLILSRPMIRVLMKARLAGRRLFQAHASTWVFPGRKGHTRGDHLTKLGVASNHALRRAYASEGRASGVPKDSIARFLNHGSESDVTDRYIRNSALGALHLVEQETISAHIVKALGKPKGL